MDIRIIALATLAATGAAQAEYSHTFIEPRLGHTAFAINETNAGSGATYGLAAGMRWGGTDDTYIGLDLSISRTSGLEADFGTGELVRIPCTWSCDWKYAEVHGIEYDATMVGIGVGIEKFWGRWGIYPTIGLALTDLGDLGDSTGLLTGLRGVVMFTDMVGLTFGLETTIGSDDLVTASGVAGLRFQF